MSLMSWAIRHGVSPAALHALTIELGLDCADLRAGDAAVGKSEAWVQSAVQLAASKLGITALRNNSGALKDQRGRLVRFGLGNTSEEQNDKFKSPDLLGWRPVLITQPMVGYTIAQVWGREVKKPGWRYTGEGREVAQKRFIDTGNSEGADFAFVSDPSTIR